jgi:hypothetical protein
MNGAILNRNKKAFWAGLVNILDGYIEEVHDYVDAENAEFHHSYYFSPRALRRLEEQEGIIFFVFDDGDIQIWEDHESPQLTNKEKEALTDAIKEQITLI